MSSRKSSQTKLLRFSGPELAELLERVVTEHGSSAAISEVNKVRSGGVAGFFCREEFEIIVSEPGAGGDQAVSPALTSSAPRPAPAVSKIRHERPTQAAESTTNPTLTDSETAKLRFQALLERRLEEKSAEEALLARRSIDRASQKKGAAQRRTVDLRPSDRGAQTDVTPADRPTDRTSPPTVTPTMRPNDHLRPVVAPDQSLLAPAPPRTPQRTGAGSRPSEPSNFWVHLQQTRDALRAFVPPATRLVVVVGPLALTVPVVRRLQCRHRLAPDDVTVLTSRAEIVSEPSWHLVRSGRQLVEAARARADQPALLVMDAPIELPIWVAPLLTRLRATGLDLVRYIVPGSPAPDDLIRFWTGPDEPYVIDLVSRVQPSLLVQLVEHDHPVATVAGVELSAELLVAMREINDG